MKNGAITWSLHYQADGVAGLRTIATLRQTLNEAFRLIDRGDVVNQIEGHGGLKGMNAGEIDAAYAKHKLSRMSWDQGAAQPLPPLR